jgi:hypothetical protein
MTTTSPKPFNRLGLDYRDEAARLGPPPVPIIDAHAHINGARACRVYDRARQAFGVVRTFTQSQLRQAEAVREALGDSVTFVAVPNYMSEDRGTAHTTGFIDDITTWNRDFGAKIVKFWCGPRGRLFAKEAGADPLLFTLDHPWRRRQMDHAASLGYMFMAHLADPDTWFDAKYTDADFYGTKASQYDAIETLADEYDVPWLIAHMGGWPEDLAFLDGFLTRHPNIVLDTSATKWMVRELSKHPTEAFAAFLRKFRGRILFGSDIVSDDAHVTNDEGWRGIGSQSNSDDDAFNLYASRYWSLRTLFETAYDGESPIADPDLAMVDPDQYDEMSAPRLKGHSLSRDELVSLYSAAAHDSLIRWVDGHGN